jgi:hypothetical protein
MRARALTVAFVALVSAGLAAQSWKNQAPEWFHINGQISGSGGAGGAASSMELHIDRYTADAGHGTLVAALKGADHAAFLKALHGAPKIGVLKIGARSFDVRWARANPAANDGRRIIAVTDAPVYFAGGGAVDAKPTEGYDVGVVEFTVDSVGLGKGTMAPAARIKAGGPVGVEIEDYSGKKIELVTVTRRAKE